MKTECVRPFGILISGDRCYSLLQPEPLSTEWEGFGLRFLVIGPPGNEVYEVVVPIQNCLVEYRHCESVYVEVSDKYISPERINQILEDQDKESEEYVPIYE